MTGIIIGAAFAVLGIAATIYYARKAERLNTERRRLTWDDLRSAADDLGRAIKRRGAPAVIVTPGLGGATFANLLANQFDPEPPVFVGIRVWKASKGSPVVDPEAFRIETTKWDIWIPKLCLQYEKGEILIVDDFVMSGDFLERLRQALIDAGVDQARIRSASVAATKVAIKNHKAPDNYWWTAEDDDFYFPWGKAR